MVLSERLDEEEEELVKDSEEIEESVIGIDELELKEFSPLDIVDVALIEGNRDPEATRSLPVPSRKLAVGTGKLDSDPSES